MATDSRPMTLGNMRANGVRPLAIYCSGRWCHHQAVMDVSALPDDLPVPSFGRRMVCPEAKLFRFHVSGRLRSMLAQALKQAGLVFPARQRGFHLFCHTYGTWMHHYGQLDTFGLVRTNRWKSPDSALRWKSDILLNPNIWNNGWDSDRIRARIREWADDFGPKILTLFGGKK